MLRPSPRLLRHRRLPSTSHRTITHYCTRVTTTHYCTLVRGRKVKNFVIETCVFLVSCFNFSFSRLKVLTLSISFSHQDTFSLSFSLVNENLLNFSFRFSHFFSFSHSSITPK